MPRVEKNMSVVLIENFTYISSRDSRLENDLLAVFISSLSFIGILGNVPVLIVYFRRKDRKASNTFIKSLGVLDLIVCAFVMPYTIVYEYHIVTSDFMCRFFEFLRHLAVFASNIILLAIAIERYVAVCHIGTKIRVRTINRCIYFIFGLGVIVAAPSVGIFAVVRAPDVNDIDCRYPHEMTHGYFCHFTYSIMGVNLVTAYQITQMAIFFMELVVIVVLYTAIYVVLWRKSKIRRKMTQGRDSSVVLEIVNSKNQRNASNVSESAMTEVCKSDGKDERSELYTDRVDNDNRAQNSEHDNFLPFRNVLERGSSKNPGLSKESIYEREQSGNYSFYCGEMESSEESSENRYKNNNKTQKGKSDCLSNICEENYSTERTSKRSNRISSTGNVDKPRHRHSYHRRTAKMLFLCTVVYFVTWMPFWLDIFNVTSSLILRYMVFFGNATNPIIYGIVNKQVRRSFNRLFVDCLKNLYFIKNLPETPDNSQIRASFSETSL